MNIIERTQEIIRQEAEALLRLSEQTGAEIADAVELIYQCSGKVVVMGVGKSGMVGQKMASSLASTGTPAIFVHASEAMHGDLGMVSSADVAILISNSGSSEEILNLVSPLKRIGCKIVAMTGNPASALGKRSDITLNIHVEREACPLGLAPTTSATAAMVLGDALMICLMEKNNFKAENYALYHPGGALGRKLLCRVKDVMTTDIPKVQENSLFRDVVYEVSNKRLGMTLVQNAASLITGLITDGDIRRAVQHFDDLKNLTAVDFMTRNFKSVSQDALLTEALEMMDSSNITTLAVKKEDDTIAGIISIHHIIDFK